MYPSFLLPFVCTTHQVNKEQSTIFLHLKPVFVFLVSCYGNRKSHVSTRIPSNTSPLPITDLKCSTPVSLSFIQMTQLLTHQIIKTILNTCITLLSKLKFWNTCMCVLLWFEYQSYEFELLNLNSKDKRKKRDLQIFKLLAGSATLSNFLWALENTEWIDQF